MRLYRCKICNSIFSENELMDMRDSVGAFFSEEGYNTIKICPFCRENNYEEGFICKKCGKFQKDYQNDELCDECINEEV